MAADQLTKWWAVVNLKHQCDELAREGEAAPRVTRCDGEALTVELGSRRAREVSFLRGPTAFFQIACAGGAACLSGEVRLGEERAGAQATRLRRDPMDQALLMLRGVPIEAPTLTSGADGQLYRVEAVHEDGRRSTVRFRYRSPAEPLRIIDRVFHFRYVENPGAAWGLLGDVDESFRRPFFMAVSIFAAVFILWIYHRTGEGQVLLPASLALILGGALGNLVDRIRFGRVVDFIDWHYEDRFRWPTFNVADALITLGVALLVADGIRAWVRGRRARKEPEGIAP